MAIYRKIRYSLITVLLFAALAVLMAFALPRTPAAAENGPICELSPVKTESSGVTYYCFDNPTSVFADGEVKIVAGQSGIYFVSAGENGETVVTFKDSPADKVYRRTTHEENTEYLIILNDGKIYSIGADDDITELTVNVGGDILDFEILNNKLYAITATQVVVAPLLETGIDGQNAYVAPLSSSRHAKINAKTITAANGKLYVSVKSVFGNKWDVCAADIESVTSAGCKLNTVLDQCNDVLALTASAENDVIYLLTRNEIIGYTTTISGGLYKKYSTDGSDVTDIFAYGDNVYTLDSLNALHVMNGKLENESVIAASASGDQGFFNVPFGITAKSSMLYVADTVNNRIAIYDNNGIRYINREFRTPVSVAADNGGTLYVAYDDNKVGIFRNNAYSTYDEITVTSTTLGKISRIVVDADKTLFVLSDSGLWKVERDYTPHRISTALYKDITLSISKSKLYALDDDKIVLLDKESGEEKSSRTAPIGAISVAVDLNDTAFALYTNKIVSITERGVSTEYALTADGQPYTLGNSMGQLLLCFMENGIDGEDSEEQNYAIILDTFRHRILKADGNAIGARFVDYSYVSPDIIGSVSAVEGQVGIIRKMRFSTPLFDYPIETKSNYTVYSGEYVIVPDYSIVAPAYKPDETPEFALVLVDDALNHRLLQGYVYKDALTDPIEYSLPPSNVCTVTAELGATVYKWPSVNAKTISGYSAVAKNTKFNMLDFVDPFLDGYGHYWYRIALDETGKEGYVPAESIVTTDLYHANILPDYNAEIIAYNGNSIAKIYSRDKATGKYTVVNGITLKAGTKIEVVGAFDSSERYTKIKFLDGKTHQTFECYVETVHIKYTGLNIVLIVAIMVIAITIILAIIIISRVHYSKKKRLDNDGDGKDENAITDTD
ncbi:MAG: hypothetical protein K2M89_06640 [Clostridiales bacterium]|nr:hypothetical protein [Clostridiales bacterium]